MAYSNEMTEFSLALQMCNFQQNHQEQQSSRTSFFRDSGDASDLYRNQALIGKSLSNILEVPFVSKVRRKYFTRKKLF